MKRKLGSVVVVASIAVASGMLASCGEDKGTSPQSGSTSSPDVSVVDNRFSPGNNTATVSEIVNWQWAGSNQHTVTSGTPGNHDGIFDSPRQASGIFSNKFESEGTFDYYCRVHGAAMTGTITVTKSPGG